MLARGSVCPFSGRALCIALQANEKALPLRSRNVAHDPVITFPYAIRQVMAANHLDVIGNGGGNTFYGANSRAASIEGHVSSPPESFGVVLANPPHRFCRDLVCLGIVKTWARCLHGTGGGPKAVMWLAI